MRGGERRGSAGTDRVSEVGDASPLTGRVSLA